MIINKKDVPELVQCLAARFGHRPTALLLGDLMRTDVHQRNACFRETVSAMVVENVVQAKEIIKTGGTVEP